jgi:hypothetical protein
MSMVVAVRGLRLPGRVVSEDSDSDEGDRRNRFVATFFPIAPVMRAGDEGWSVIVHDLAPLRAAMRDGRAVPVEDFQLE